MQLWMHVESELYDPHSSGTSRGMSEGLFGRAPALDSVGNDSLRE
jgi:hypothetical protein